MDRGEYKMRRSLRSCSGISKRRCKRISQKQARTITTYPQFATHPKRITPRKSQIIFVVSSTNLKLPAWLFRPTSNGQITTYWLAIIGTTSSEPDLISENFIERAQGSLPFVPLVTKGQPIMRGKLTEQFYPRGLTLLLTAYCAECSPLCSQKQNA